MEGIRFEAPKCHVTWRIIERDLEGNIVSDHESSNLVVNTGREQTFRNLFAVGASGPFICIGVGASATAATVNDSRLTHELIYNPTRKLLFDKTNGTLDNADIETEITVISGVTYYRKIVVQGTWDSTDLNNNNQFAEYGVFTSTTLPSTPTSTSGVMFNHFIDPAPILKTSANSVTAQITVRN